jgi:hypothetical protein
MIWRAIGDRTSRSVRRLGPRARKAVAAGTALAVAAALVVAAVAVTSGHSPAQPVQRLWGSAAARPHRVPPTVTMGRLVNGRVVPAPPGHPGKAAAVTGPRVPTRLPKGAVPIAGRPRPLKFPVRGSRQERTRVLAPPAAKKKAGYNPKTSHQLPAKAGADRIVYANADGTSTAFEFQQPVNFQRLGGQWTPIDTSLRPAGSAGAAGSPTPSSGSPAPSSAPPSSLAPSSPTPSSSLASSLSPTMSLSPAASSPLSPAAPTAPASAAPGRVPSQGWTERSAAEPVSFAAFADSPALVTLPIDGSHAVAFGIQGAAHAAGAAQGNAVTYPGVAGSSDIRFSAGTGMVKEQIILRSAAAPRSWVFPLHLSGLRAVTGPGGAIRFADAAGRILAYVPGGFMGSQ